MTESVLLTDEEFDELDELLTSDAMPADCMNLEMLDGYLAGVLASPVPILVERWIPAVWSAEGEEFADVGGRMMQRAITLVLRYHDELLATIGPDGEWEPFCYAPAGGQDELALAEEWVAGFEQGVETWPGGWEESVGDEDVDFVREALEDCFAPWQADGATEADPSTRLEWLAESAACARSLVGRWLDLERKRPGPVAPPRGD